MTQPWTFLALSWVLAAVQAPPEGDTASLRARVVELERKLRERDRVLDELTRDLKVARLDLLALSERLTVTLPAAPFASAPPAGSDAIGVARTVVFAPRLEVDLNRRRDLVRLRIRRVEPTGLVPVGEAELGSDGFADLPLDRNGALYSVDWSTSDGHTYALTLRDGLTGLPAATVQVRPLQAEGRFLFVGYRRE
jgi:hypothetical protein